MTKEAKMKTTLRTVQMRDDGDLGTNRRNCAKRSNMTCGNMTERCHGQYKPKFFLDSM